VDGSNPPDGSNVVVVVLGEQSLTRDLIGVVLGAVSIDDRAPALGPIHSGSAPTVAILIDPETRHWDEVSALDARAVVVTSGELAVDELTEAIFNGAEAVLTSSAETDVLRHAVAVVAAGGTLLSPSQTRSFVEAARRSRAAAAGADVTLSGREREILTSIVQGDSVKQTARSLEIRPKTVENVQSRLFRKLNVRNRAQAVGRAYALGLVADMPGPSSEAFAAAPAATPAMAATAAPAAPAATPATAAMADGSDHDEIVIDLRDAAVVDEPTASRR
jgi:DNA-binding NarL/FixJ family response regulator